MYVTEATYHRVKKYNKNTFEFISVVGGNPILGGPLVSPYYGTGNYQFYTPQQITVDENFVYVADYTYHRIKILDKNFNYYATITSAGLQLAEEYIYYPYGITTDENYIYVTEHLNHRVKKINKSDYSVVSVFSGISPGEEDMVLPFEIVHDDEYIYYSRSGLYRVVKRRISDMKVVGIIGGPISGNTTTMFVDLMD
jgi:DNA-binding beta-propeller fold protein YncE